MTFPLSNGDYKLLNGIEELFKNTRGLNFTNEEYIIYEDMLNLLCEKKVLFYIQVDGGHLFTLMGDYNGFEAFRKWAKEQDKKAKKITRREWKIAIISAIIGAVVGLIPTFLQLLGVINCG